MSETRGNEIDPKERDDLERAQAGRDVLLLGVVGSTAYGIAHEGSDRDYLGVFRAPTKEVLGLQGRTVVEKTYAKSQDSDTDVTLHEVGKFLGLALKCNPTVTELLWLPSYEVETPAGDLLVSLRKVALSEDLVRSAYGGYAIAQARRLRERTGEGKEGFSSNTAGRTAKHARHCLRLCRSGASLLQTGELLLDVSSIRDELFAAGDLAVADPEAFEELFARELAALDAIESVLPLHPDRERVNEILVELRMQQLRPPP